MAYIGVQPADAYTSFAVQHFTTSATDTFTLDFPVANENEIALFINNVRQEPGSSYAYTASGTTLTLSSAITGSDSMYCVFIGKAVQTVTPASGSVTNDMIAYPLAKSGATVSTFNRTTSDGDIVELQKDGTTVGSISSSPNFNIQRASGSGFNFGTTNISPLSSGSLSDNTIDLGFSSYRWNDLYLGGNIYLGGTGSANALNDYEEGTFTPSFSQFTGTVSNADYTKIGNIVHIQMYISSISGGSAGDAEITNLPFTCDTNGWSPFIVNGQFSGVGFTYQVLGRVEGGTSKLSFKNNNDNNIHGSDIDASSFMTMQFTYKTS